MKKKEFKEPLIRVVEVKSCDIICGSGEGSYNETLPNGQFGDSNLKPKPDGYIWAD